MAASTLGQQLVGTFFQACESARCLFGSPSKKQEQEESTDLHALLEKENHSVTMNDLSSDMVRDIFSFLPLEEMWEKRSVGKFFLTFCNTDSRWIPIIPPDFIKNEVMTLAKHGKMLRWLYLVKYKKWLQQWHHNKDHDALLAGSRSKFYDGYFSLAPWRHFQNYTSYPQPWLHRMVHCQPCPTTMVAQEPPSKRRRLARLRGSNNNHRSTANAQAFSKSPHPTWKKWKHKAGDSSFFQCRLRSKEIFDLDSDYDFTSDIYTTPILENCDVSLQRKVLKVVLQPVNFRIHKDGKKHDRLPDHDMEMLHRWNKECATILECYFGRGTATVAPLLYHSTKLFFGRSGTLRKEKEGLVEPGTDKRVIQVQSETLQGLGATVLENLGMYTSAQDDQETLILYIVAPHMFKKNYEIEYVFNSFLKDESIGNTRVGAVSVFQIARLTHLSMPKRSTMYTSLVLSTVLHYLDLEYCENAHCALNNMDSVDEFVEDATLLICPGCIRKLQLCHALGQGSNDVPVFLNGLRRALSENQSFAEVNGPDLKRLQDLGVEGENY